MAKSEVVYTGKVIPGGTAADTLFNIMEDNRKRDADRSAQAERDQRQHTNAMESIGLQHQNETERQKATQAFQLSLESLRDQQQQTAATVAHARAQQQLMDVGFAQNQETDKALTMAAGRGLNIGGFGTVSQEGQVPEAGYAGETKVSIAPANPLAGPTRAATAHQFLGEQIREREQQQNHVLQLNRMAMEQSFKMVGEAEQRQAHSLARSFQEHEPDNIWIEPLLGVTAGQSRSEGYDKLLIESLKQSDRLRTNLAMLKESGALKERLATQRAETQKEIERMKQQAKAGKLDLDSLDKHIAVIQGRIRSVTERHKALSAQSGQALSGSTIQKNEAMQNNLIVEIDALEQQLSSLSALKAAAGVQSVMGPAAGSTPTSVAPTSPKSANNPENVVRSIISKHAPKFKQTGDWQNDLRKLMESLPDDKAKNALMDDLEKGGASLGKSGG